MRLSNWPRNCVPATSAVRSIKIDLLALQLVRYFFVDDPLRQALGDRRFADAGLTDQTRVILLPPVQNLHHALGFHVAADNAVELPVARLLREVLAVGIEKFAFFILLSVRLIAARGDFAGAPPSAELKASPGLLFPALPKSLLRNGNVAVCEALSSSSSSSDVIVRILRVRKSGPRGRSSCRAFRR